MNSCTMTMTMVDQQFHLLSHATSVVRVVDFAWRDKKETVQLSSFSSLYNTNLSVTAGAAHGVSHEWRQMFCWYRLLQATGSADNQKSPGTKLWWESSPRPSMLPRIWNNKGNRLFFTNAILLRWTAYWFIILCTSICWFPYCFCTLFACLAVHMTFRHIKLNAC